MTLNLTNTEVAEAHDFAQRLYDAATGMKSRPNPNPSHNPSPEQVRYCSTETTVERGKPVWVMH